MPRLHLAGYLFLCLVWGSTWMAIRVLVDDVPPLHGAALRFLLSTILLGAVVAIRRTPLPRDGRAWAAFAVLGVTMIGFPYASVFWAERRITSGATAVIYATLPLAVALFTPLLLHQRVPRRAVYAMTVALGGIAVLFYRGFSFQQPQMLIAGILLLVGIAMQGWSYAYAKVRLKGLSPLVSTAAQFFVGSVVLFASSFVMEREHPHWTTNSLLSLAYLVVFGSVLSFTVYYWLLERMPPYQLSSFNFVTPIIAVIIGALFGEAVPLPMIMAMVIVLASVATVLRSDNAPEITTLRGEHVEEHG